MTRPRKQTVDWFPHSVNHGKTIFVLERRWGIAGYGFWFKLLEILGNTDGHFVDADDPATMEFVSSYTYTDTETCLKILDLLATLDAIDPKLWKDKIIWSENFVNGLAALYRNRNVPIPVRPDNYCKKSGPGGVSSKKSCQKPVEEVEEVEELEVVKDIAPPGVPPAPALKFFSCKYFEVDFDYRAKLAKEYPALTDELLLKEFSKMEDWITDNSKKRTFKANGHLSNQKLFIRNWLSKVYVKGQDIFTDSNKPKSFDALKKWGERRSQGNAG